MGKGRSDRRGSAPKPASGFEWLYLQYLLVTGLYMLEPWERTLFNIVFALVLSAGSALLFTFASSSIPI
eukprot:PDM64190.1 hypothetical protein PRIPAC_54434 [Pristionchus pacificus]